MPDLHLVAKCLSGCQMRRKMSQATVELLDLTSEKLKVKLGTDAKRLFLEKSLTYQEQIRISTIIYGGYNE